MIEARNLRKQYGDLVAVDDVSFHIPRGVVFGLLGPNGAGKTTTISMLVGVLRPDKGQVVIDGNGDPGQASVRLKIGGAPQSLALYEELTAEENLRFFGRLYNLSGKRLHERVDWCLETAGLSERRSTQVKTFSGGMKRRLNLVCALVHEPPIILLDEPTAGVDPQSRNMIFEKIELLRNEGRTVVYTTHYMEEAQRLCDRVAIMDHGRILDSDTVDNLLSRHGGTSVVTITLAQLPDADMRLPGRVDGTTLRFETSSPIEDVADLATRGVKFRTLHVDRPDLESVFLNLTGRSLRDT
jgi:ABC-2 type transport system ATP-binding protein